MKKPILGYVFLFLFFAMFAYGAFLASIQKGDLTTEEVLPFFAGGASITALYIWMVINLFKNWRAIKRPVLWGFLLFFCNWIAAIIYFLFIYTPSEKTNITGTIQKFDYWLHKGDSKYEYYFKLSIICLVITTLHHFTMMQLYTDFGLPNNKLFYLIFIKLVNLPMNLLIEAIYNIFRINTEVPSANLILFARTLKFIYRYMLFYMIIIVIIRYANHRKNN